MKHYVFDWLTINLVLGLLFYYTLDFVLILVHLDKIIGTYTSFYMIILI